MLALFGSPAFIDRGSSHALAMSEKTLALLVILACNADRPLSRVRLASQLWPDVDESEARANLRRHLYKLAKALPHGAAEPVRLSKNSAQWNRDCGLAVDVVRFLDAVEAGRLHDAVALYGGPLALGSFDDAVAEQRDRFEAIYLEMLEGQIDDARGGNDAAREIGLLQRRAAHDPLNEAWVRDLAQARLDAGDRAGAQRDLSALATRLRAELHVEPDAQTRDLLSRSLQPGVYAAATNLPIEVDSFVGRDRAIEAVGALLRTHAWVTLTGPAGIGKTRLAVHVARTHMQAYSAGVWFVDLASATTWAHALTLLASVVGVTLSADDAQQTLRAFLMHRRALLVLDNCEQLDETAARGIGDLVNGTAAAVIATSRRRLDGVGEAFFAVDSLEIPSGSVGPSDAARYSAIRLFSERASAVAPGFALSHDNVGHVVSIVRRLDGLPLAVELVAARANLLTIAGIAKRLDDIEGIPQKERAGKHQTVTAAIRWSYELLAERERRLLRRLAVFEGTFDLHAIESICGDERELPVSRIFAVLSELVEASLVVSVGTESDDEQRYLLLETVRRFLRALADPDVEDVRLMHATYFAEVGARARRAYDEVGTSAYHTLMRREQSNVEAALTHAWKLRDPALIASLVTACERVWTSDEVERRRPVIAYVERDETARRLPAGERARLYFALAGFASTAADWPRCKALRERAAAAFRESGDEAEALSVEATVAFVDNFMGASLRDVTIPALYAIKQRLEDLGAPRWHAARVAYNLAAMELSLGGAEVALPLALSALAVFRDEKRTNYLANCLATLARIYVELGEIKLAQQCVDESIAPLSDPAYAVLLADAYGLRALLQLTNGDPLGALRSCAESLRLFEYAFELRFVARTILTAMKTLVALDKPDLAARIAGYILERARATGTAGLTASIERSPAYDITRDALGSGFDTAVQLGATDTFEDVCRQIELAG